MKKYFALALVCLMSFPSMADTSRLKLHYSLDPDAIRYFNTLISNGCTTPSGSFETAVNNFIVSEKAVANWGNQDFSYIFATSDSCTASINLSQPLRYKITWTGACTYSVANGLNGDGSTCFGDTNVGESSYTRSSRNNSHVFGCTGSFSLIFGGVAAIGTYKIDASTNKTTRVSATAQVTDTAGGGAGCHFGDRINSSTVINTGKNGVVQSSAVSNASSAPDATHVGICVNNGGFCTSTSKTFFAEVGQVIPNESAHYTNVRTLLVSLGAQGI